MAFAQTLRIFRKIMLAILRIWLCLFCENFSILTKILILGQPPRKRLNKPGQQSSLGDLNQAAYSLMFDDANNPYISNLFYPRKWEE